jgi:RNA-binding motif X-linked protein 2
LFRNVKNLNKINDREIQLGAVGTGSSWHKRYRESAWIFFGGISYELNEGDLICVFSQYV